MNESGSNDGDRPEATSTDEPTAPAAPAAPGPEADAPHGEMPDSATRSAGGPGVGGPTGPDGPAESAWSGARGQTATGVPFGSTGPGPGPDVGSTSGAGAGAGTGAGSTAGAGGPGGGGAGGGPFRPGEPGAASGGSGPAGPLTRSTDDRVIAGVCGGLGRHLGVDPVVFRVLFVVFAIFGGIGALVYGAMWLIAPADGQDRSAAQRLAGGTFDLDSVIAVAVGLFGLLAFSRFLLAGFGAEVPFLLLAAFCAALVLANNRSALSRFTNRDQRGGWGNPPPWQGPPPGWGGPPPGAGPGGWGTPPHDADQSQSQSAPDQTTSTATMGGGGRPPTGWPPAPPGGSTMTGPGPTARAPGPPPWWQQPRPVATSPTWPSASGVSGGPAAVGGFGAPGDGGASPPAGGGPGGPYGAPPASGRPYQPPARQQRSGFGCLIVFLGIVLAGALLSLDAANTVHLGLRTVLAIVLVILGVGLAMGAWYGRARVVILLASIVTVALVVVASPGMPAYGGVGGRDWHPTAATSGTLSYQLSAGDGRLDLTALDSGNGWVPVNASVGFGRLLVWVPDSMTVVVTEHAGAGTLIVGDGPFETGNRGGLGVNRSYRFEPTAGQPSRGTIQLSAKVGIGVVEVRRVAA